MCAKWLCNFIWVFKISAPEEAKSHWLQLFLLFSTVRFRMSPQIDYLRWGIVALVAFVWLFSFIICVSQGNINIFIKALIYTILIHHQQVENVFPCLLSPSNWENGDCRLEERTNESESYCWRESERLQDWKTARPPDKTRPEQNRPWRKLGSEHAKSHWLHLFGFSPLCVFKCFLKLLASENAKSHWLHLFNFSPLCVFKCVLKVNAREEA